MELFLIDVDPGGYDVITDVVVAAPNQHEAEVLTYLRVGHGKSIEAEDVQHIGTACPGTEPGIIHESFHAG